MEHLGFAPSKASEVSPKPPGPKEIPLLGSMVGFRRDPNGFLLQMAQRYGDISRFTAGSKEFFLLNHPDLIKDVLVTHSGRFRKGRLVERAKGLLGEGLITSEGDFHLRQRRTIQPGFACRRLAAFGDVVGAAAARAAARWRNGAVVDVDREMRRVSLAIVAQTLFDSDIDDDDADIRHALETLEKWYPLLMLPYHLGALPLPVMRNVRRARRYLDATIYRLIDERRNGDGCGHDVISMLLSARDPEGGSAMSDKQVRDEALTLFLAGQDTTANALTWTLYLISRHPDVEARLHAELADVLHGEPPTASDLERLPYTDMVFTESLRLFPPVGRMGRRPLEDYCLGPYTVPAGSVVFVSPYAMHRDPRYFPNPLRFVPERWTPSQRAQRPKYSFFPYGGGARMCIGAQFASMIGVMVIATVAQQWKLTLMPGQRVARRKLLTMRPKYGMKMIVTEC